MVICMEVGVHFVSKVPLQMLLYVVYRRPADCHNELGSTVAIEATPSHCSVVWEWRPPWLGGWWPSPLQGPPPTARRPQTAGSWCVAGPPPVAAWGVTVTSRVSTTLCHRGGVTDLSGFYIALYIIYIVFFCQLNYNLNILIFPGKVPWNWSMLILSFFMVSWLK